MRLGKVLIGCGVTSVSILAIGASFLGSKQAEAQSIPACRNIQPRPGQVCYTEHPFSARQRDEGGTKNWSFIVERVAPNYVIVDYQILVDRSFGAASRPTGSIVSAKGNASIIQESTRQEEKLGEIRSQLKGKIQGCHPPVCGQLQGQIDRIDREIERLSDTRRTAVSAGGNEKIQFTHTTSVSCTKWLGVKDCGSGAAIDGKVRVNQRYLGDPNSLRQESISLVEEATTVLRSALETPKVYPFSQLKVSPVPPVSARGGKSFDIEFSISSDEIQQVDVTAQDSNDVTIINPIPITVSTAQVARTWVPGSASKLIFHVKNRQGESFTVSHPILLVIDSVTAVSPIPVRGGASLDK